MIKFITFILLSSGITIAEINSIALNENQWVILSATQTIATYDSIDNDYDEEDIKHILIVNTTTQELLRLNTTLLEHNDSFIDTFEIINSTKLKTQKVTWEPNLPEIALIEPQKPSIPTGRWTSISADQTIIEYDSVDNDSDIDEIESILFFNSKTRRIFRLFSNKDEVMEIFEDKIDSTLTTCGSIKDVKWESKVKSMRLYTDICPPVLLNAEKEHYYIRYVEKSKLKNGGLYMIIGGSVFTVGGIILTAKTFSEYQLSLLYPLIGIGITIGGGVMLKIGKGDSEEYLDKYQAIK